MLDSTSGKSFRRGINSAGTTFEINWMGLNGGPLPIWLKHERHNQLEANEMSLIGLLATARVCRSLRSIAWMSALILLAVLTYPVLADDVLPTEPLLRLNTDLHTAIINR